MDAGAGWLPSSRPIGGLGLSERARVGLKYRGWAVALTAGLIVSMAAAATVLAAEPASDIVMDGVLTVTWVEPEDGPMAGASIQISYYRDGDEIPGLLPAATMDSEGVVVITGVPRQAEGALPMLLDIRGDRSTATVDEAGCTTHEGWQAESTGVASDLTLDVVLASDTKSISVSCPEPTPPDNVEPTPTAEPTPTPGVVQPTPKTTPTGGGVLGTVGTPGVTPPETDTVSGPARPTGSPFVPILLVLAAVATFLVSAVSLAYARAHSRPRPRRR
jgi:hypothetical protein